MKLSKIKLNKIYSENLNDREMKKIKGGAACTCGCCGPSTTADNGNANHSAGLNSTMWCDGEVVVTP
ncbi:MAG: TIGR04149 family rSAM-modified RiPP [Tannerella sp.]|jgi:natural product precursor|nr:TIGR04149 family rSAM-modified RiPP [Tannerella sp.]